MLNNDFVMMNRANMLRICMMISSWLMVSMFNLMKSMTMLRKTFFMNKYGQWWQCCATQGSNVPVKEQIMTVAN